MQLLLVLSMSYWSIVFSSRLERLQRIFSKVQMESGTYDGQLSHLETLLQTVSAVHVSP